MSTALTPGQALVRWVEHADLAIDTAETITLDQFEAMCARPEAPGRIADGVTSYSQEQLDLMRQQERDKRPDVTKVGEHEVRRWNVRRLRRHDRIIHLMLRHNEAIAKAMAFCSAEDATAAKLKRASRPTADEMRAAIAEQALNADLASQPGVAA